MGGWSPHRPPLALGAESGDELGGGVEPSLHGLRLLLELLLLGGARLELLVELLEHDVERGHLLLDLGQVLGRLPQRLLGVGHGLPLRVDHLGDAVVVDDGVDPHQQPRGGGRDALHRLGRELGVLEVGLDRLDRLVVEAVLVELDQRLEEVALGHHRLGALPAHVLAALEQHHAHAHLRHHLRRLGEGLELRDVLLAQVRQRV